MQDLLLLCVFISDPVQCLPNSIFGLIIHKNLIIWLILIEKLLLNRLFVIPTIWIYLFMDSIYVIFYFRYGPIYDGIALSFVFAGDYYLLSILEFNIQKTTLNCLV